MPRTAREELQKVTISLYHGDMDILQMTYPKQGGSKIIRELVRAHIEKIESNIQKELPNV